MPIMRNLWLNYIKILNNTNSILAGLYGKQQHIFI